MSKLQVEKLPFASVAVYVRVVVPIGKHEPLNKPAFGAEDNVINAVLQLSVAVGADQVAILQVSVVESA